MLVAHEPARLVGADRQNSEPKGPVPRALVFALEELAFFSKELIVLGVYPAHAFRDTFREEKD